MTTNINKTLLKLGWKPMGLGREWDLYTNRTAMHLEGQVAQVFRK
jgi:hypothetical protein